MSDKTSPSPKPPRAKPSALKMDEVHPLKKEVTMEASRQPVDSLSPVFEQSEEFGDQHDKQEKKTDQKIRTETTGQSRIYSISVCLSKIIFYEST